MKKEIPTKKHLEKLAEYNLQTIPPEKWMSVRYQPGEAITREGVEIENLALVIGGMAKVYRTAPNGRNLILCYYLSDGVIGEIELLTRRKRDTSTVTAISEFECIAIDSEICAAELKTNIPFSNKLGTTLAEKLERSTDNYVLSALCSAEERLCTYILQNAPTGLFRDVLTDVACSVGTSYRHVLRLLSELCSEGILRKSESGYEIMNREELIRRSRATMNQKSGIVKKELR